MNRGTWYVIEGLDGSGKDTQAQFLMRYLAAVRHNPCVVLNAPCSRGVLGSVLRRSLAGPTRQLDLKRCPARVAQQLFTAEKVEHYFQCIEPMLADGIDVIQVRWTLSAPAYSAPVPVREVLELQHSVMDTLVPEPDVTVYLDVDLETAFARMSKRGKPAEFYESKLESVIERYRKILDWGSPAMVMAGQVVIVPGHGDVATVEKAMIALVSAL